MIKLIIPIIEKAIGNEINCPSNPQIGKKTIIIIEKIILLNEIMVARCCDGMSSFIYKLLIGYKLAFKKFRPKNITIEMNEPEIPNMIILMLILSGIKNHALLLHFFSIVSASIAPNDETNPFNKKMIEMITLE